MIIPIFILAFSTWIRAMIWFIYQYAVTMGVVKTGIYSRWLDWGLTSRTLLDNAAKQTEKLKNEVKERKYELRRIQREKQEEEAKKGTEDQHSVKLTVSFSRNLNTSVENHEMGTRSRHAAVEEV